MLRNVTVVQCQSVKLPHHYFRANILMIMNVQVRN